MAVLTEDVLNSFKDSKRKEFHTAAVGMSFVEKSHPEHIEAVNNGDWAVLVPQFDNDSDATAVGVIHNETGNRVAYIKRELAGEIWNNVVKNGDLYLAKIQLTGRTEGRENLGMNLRVIRMYHEQEKAPKKSAPVPDTKSLGDS